MAYNQFLREVVKRSKLPLPPNSQYEFEARFRGYDKESFELLKTKLKAMSENPAKKEWKPYTEKEYIDFYISGRRYTTQEDSDRLKIMDKLGIMDHIEDNVRYALSQERDEGEAEDMIYVNDTVQFLGEEKMIELMRKKNRITFQVNELLIEMTEVKQGNVMKYEVEIEVDPKHIKKNEKLFGQLVNILLKLRPSNDAVIAFYNSMMANGKMNNELIFGTVTRARDLKVEDITRGGILDYYQASVKADGEQRFLVFHSSGVYLLYPKNIITRLGDFDSSKHPSDTIIVGEMIEKTNLKNKNYEINAEKIFVPFDATVVKGKNISRLDYIKRKEEMATVLKSGSYLKVNGVNKLYILTKQYFTISSVDTFYKAMRDVMKERSEVMYKEDGIIITPIKSGYTPSGSRERIEDRVLGKHTDVCKWKPQDKLTIDFLYEYDGEHIIKTKQNENVHLKETNIGEKIRFIDLDKLKKKSGSIIEFRPVEVKEEYVVFAPERIREDKIFPNDYYIVENLYKMIQNPIYESTLVGMDTVLMRKHHNVLKKELYNQCKKGSYLIDIGSGKGGDVYKWKGKFEKILAIEPNVTYIKELERRIKVCEMENVVEVLNTHGEDTDSIKTNVETFLPEDLEGKKVYISFMFSMSFFWESDRTLSSLSDTINEINKVIEERDGDRAEIIYTTIDGKRLDAILEKYNSSKDLEYRTIDLNTIYIRNKKSDKDIQIVIKDSNTVTTEQTEYFVYPKQLLEKINYINAKTFYGSAGTDKMIMSEQEKIYSSMVQVGRAVYSVEKVASTPDTRLVVHLDRVIEDGSQRYFVGDDEVEKMSFIGKNIYRIATIDNSVSLIHSVLKAVDTRYMDWDGPKRHEECNKFISLLNYNLALDNISMHTKHLINVVEGSSVTRHGQGKKQLFLYKNKDGTYEPLAKKMGDEYCTSFM